MQLLDYLALNDISVTKFAAKIKMTPVTIHAFLKEKRCPTLLTRKKIEIATQGKVRMEDWKK